MQRSFTPVYGGRLNSPVRLEGDPVVLQLQVERRGLRVQFSLFVIAYSINSCSSALETLGRTSKPVLKISGILVGRPVVRSVQT